MAKEALKRTALAASGLLLAGGAVAAGMEGMNNLDLTQKAHAQVQQIEKDYSVSGEQVYANKADKDLVAKLDQEINKANPFLKDIVKWQVEGRQDRRDAIDRISKFEAKQEAKDMASAGWSALEKSSVTSSKYLLGAAGVLGVTSVAVEIAAFKRTKKSE